MVSMLTCMVIKSRDNEVVTFEDDGKFGWFCRFVDEPDHPPYLSHEAVFSAEDEAQANGDDALQQIRDVNLSSELRSSEGTK